MSKIACIGVLLLVLSGCKTTGQGLVLSVETRVCQKALEDNPTTLRLEYRFGDPNTLNTRKDEQTATR